MVGELRRLIERAGGFERGAMRNSGWPCTYRGEREGDEGQGRSLSTLFLIFWETERLH